MILMGGRILVYLHLLRYAVDEAGPTQALPWLCLPQHRLAMSFAGVNFDHLPSTIHIPLPHPLYYPHLVQHYVNYWDPRIRVLLPCRI